MTEQELDQIVEKHQGSLAEGKVAPGKEDAAKKRKGFSPQKATRSAIVQHFLPADVSGVAVESDVLAGSAVCFLDYGKHKKHELEAIVRRLGGKVFMNIVPAVKYVFGQDVDSYKMKSAVRAEKADILSIDWLLECASKGGRVPLQPRHYIYLAPQGNGENAVERFFERSDARFSHRDVRAMLERHLTSDAADRLLSQVPFGEVVAPLDEAGLLDDDRAIFWGCCMCFVDAIEPATDGPPSREAVPGPFLHGVAEAARATAPGWRWRRWWEWEKLKIEVRLRGSQLSSALVKGVTHLVLSNATSSDKPADARELLQVLANSGACKETLSWLKRQLLRGEVMLVSRRWIEDCISGEGSLDARSCRIPSDGYRAVFAPADVGDWPWSDFGVVEALPVPGKAVGGAVAQTADRKGRGRRRGRSKAARQVVRRRTAGVRTRGRARRGGITTIEEGGDAEHGFSGEPSGGGNEGAHEGTSDQCAPAMHEEANSQPSDSSGPTRANSDGRGLRAECPGRLRRRTHKPDADEMESHAAGGSIEDFETSDDKNPSDPDFSPSLEDTPVGSKRKRRTSSRVIDETEEEDSEDSGLPAQQRPPGAMASLLEESTQPLPWEPRQDTHSTATASRSAAPRSGISAALDAVTDSDASPGPGSPHEAPTIDGTHKGSQPTGSATGALSSDHQQIFGGREPQTKTGEQEEGGSGYQRLTALLAQHGPLLVPSRDSGTRHGDPTVPTKSTAAPMEVKAEEHTVCDLGATKGNEEKESQKNNKKTSLFGERVRALLGDT
ncbi:unnamed protein product [Ostreobium quekettii]|uniref:BRCT domain-containing protein n=1 Tax=Ostreobium quekettii TaxID=121088 RepID=A0A8S1IQK0_9CHLO|nr:unnamed protein product [Ostreobium quekettii]|eukprot:evm.model.scf_822.2 EVM.evm.TU.scf_822.2   scf_822:2638-8493(-)